MPKWYILATCIVVALRGTGMMIMYDSVSLADKIPPTDGDNKPPHPILKK